MRIVGTHLDRLPEATRENSLKEINVLLANEFSGLKLECFEATRADGAFHNQDQALCYFPVDNKKKDDVSTRKRSARSLYDGSP